MKRVHVLRIEGAAADFVPLARAARDAGLRLGWLELRSVEAPATLSAATRAGMLRAVAAGPRETVTVKQRRGGPVLADLLREHFRGCAAVLVDGDVAAPTLCRSRDGWAIVLPDRRLRHFATGELIGALRRPRPFSA